MLDIRMKDENTSWQEWYEENPRPRKYKVGEHGSGLVHGFGLQDLDYITIIRVDGMEVYKCRAYACWERMVRRCYSPKLLNVTPTYRMATVSQDWKTSSEFKSWYEYQQTECGGESLHLDKDILFPGNKSYNKDTCCFVPQFINKALNVCEGLSGSLPIGVVPHYLARGDVRYTSAIHKSTGVKINLGRFDNPQEAHKEWQLARASMIEAAIEKYKLMSCYREDVAYAVKARADKLRYDAKFGLETTRLP